MKSTSTLGGELGKPFLTIGCITRGRSEAVRRLILSIDNHVKNRENIEIIIRADEDDETVCGIDKFINEKVDLDFKISLIRGKRLGPKFFAHMCNEIAFVSKGNWIWFVEDEIEFETVGFDQILKDRFTNLPDGGYLISCPDRNKFPLVPGNFIIGKKWLKFFGYLFHPDYPVHQDPWIGWIMRTLNREIYETRVKIRDTGSRGTGKPRDAIAIKSSQDRIYSPQEVKIEWHSAFEHRRKYHRYLYEEKFKNPFLRIPIFRILNRKCLYFMGIARYIYRCLTVTEDTNLSIPFLRKKTFGQLMRFFPGLIIRG